MELMTAREAGEVLRISRTSLYRLVKSGELPYLRVGRKCLRFQMEELLGYMKTCANRGENRSKAESATQGD
ncbi:MAG: helix-turn-helix domain-containing protein [Spirochaetales bacterium]|jgi:excisionase family DNA binding protein|nr:helix-turn-helix domain-containing protein [Spirochaetales bacterium]